MIPGMMAYFSFTLVLGIKTNSPVNMAQVRMKGIRRTRNFIRGASNTKSSMFFTMVDIKMVTPLESTISRGSKSRMEK